MLLKCYFPYVVRRKGTVHVKDGMCVIETRGTIYGNEAGL